MRPPLGLRVGVLDADLGAREALAEVLEAYTITGAGDFYDPGTLTRDNTLISAMADPYYKPQQYYYTDAITDHVIDFMTEHTRKHKVDWRIVDAPIDVYFCAIGVQKGNDALRQKLTETIKALQKRIETQELLFKLRVASSAVRVPSNMPCSSRTSWPISSPVTASALHAWQSCDSRPPRWTPNS